MSRRFWIGILGASMLCVPASTRAAAPAVPGLLTQQGRLFDSANNPVTGSTTFVFTMYDAATAGTPLWTETQTITLDSGYFSAQLGEVTAIPPTTFATAASTGKTIYLGIKVNTDPELSPRQPLLSVPYALVAQNAIGDITPNSVSINGTPVIDSSGHWVGPSMGGGVMASGVTPPALMGAALGVTGAAGTDNHLWPLTSIGVGNASHCSVTATANICGHPLPAVNEFIVSYSSARTSATGGSPAGTPQDSTFGSWLSAPLANTSSGAYTCSAGTTGWTFPVTAGTNYDFGCDFTTQAAIPGYGTNPGGGAYCMVSVVCF
jgi:hypothetical protein